MGARTIAIIGFVGVALRVAPAHADRTVKLTAVSMSVTIPDGWALASSDGTDSFTSADGSYLGSLAVVTSDCARVLATLGGQAGAQIVERGVTPLDGWSGFHAADGGQTLGTYCRDVDITARYAAIVSGPPAEVAPLLRALSAAIDAQEAVFEQFKPENRPDDETTHAIRLLTLGVGIQAPTNWSSTYNESFDWLKRHGAPVAKVSRWMVKCARAPAWDTADQFPGWTSVEVDGDRGYCHSSGKAFVEFEQGKMAAWLLPAIGEGLERRRIDAIPTTFERFGPDRYELGLAQFDPDPDDLFVEAGWGLSAAVGKTPWRDEPGLTWSYQARLAATGPGFPASADVGIGLNLRLLALQAIVGIGAAGDPAPLAVHAGGQVDLLVWRGFGGFDFSMSHVWRDGGTATRLQGGFLLGSRRAYSLCLGWESRLETSLVTINLSVMRLPAFD